MNAIVVQVQVARDRKRYPAAWVLPEPERNRARTLTHRLVCAEGLSYRQAQRELLEEHGLRRSLGIMHSDLTGFECASCADGGSGG